jgi:hypothetical protein
MARARLRGHRLCGLAFAVRLSVLRARLRACRPAPPAEPPAPAEAPALVVLTVSPRPAAALPRFGRRVALVRRPRAA